MNVEKSILSALLLFIHFDALACSSCRAAVKAAVYNENFLIHFSMLIAPLLLLSLLAMAVYKK